MLEHQATQRFVTTSNGVKTGTIGLLTAFTPEIFKGEYFTRIISGIIDALRPSPYELKLIMIKDGDSAESLERIFSRSSVDGFLLLTWRIHPRYVEGALNGQKHVPMVVVNDYSPDVKTNIVYTDASEGTQLAMRHLFNRGFRRLGMIQAPTQDSLDAQERERIFREMIEKEGLELDPEHFRQCDYFFEEDGYIKTLEMIQSARKLPRALLCFNDDLAIGTIRALREEKILVPQEVAVVGFDGIERGKYVNPPLTTVRQPLEQMGRAMVQVATGLVQGELSPPVQVRFDQQLVIRQSA